MMRATPIKRATPMKRCASLAAGLLFLASAVFSLDAAPAEQATVTGYSAASLYNAANAYARAGKPGLAVLNYERARLLTPGDPDIEVNLSKVREAAKLPRDLPQGFERAVTVASPTLLAWVALLGVLLAGASLIGAQWVPRRKWLRRSALVCGLALVGLTLCNAAVVWPLLHEAVVLNAAAPVRVAPVPMGDPLFVLPEAATVRMTAAHEDFVLVQTRDGRSGWMARVNLAPVVPKQ